MIYRILFISFIVLFSFFSVARPSMYTWNKIKEDSDLVIYAYVQSAEVIEYNDDKIRIKEPRVKLEVIVEDVFFDNKSRVTSNQKFTVLLENWSNPVPVGESGFFFLNCESSCIGVDYQYSAWSVTHKAVLDMDGKTIGIEVIDFDKLLIGRIPKVLWTKHREQTYKDGKWVLSTQTFMLVKTLKENLAVLLNET